MWSEFFSFGVTVFKINLGNFFDNETCLTDSGKLRAQLLPEAPPHIQVNVLRAELSEPVPFLSFKLVHAAVIRLLFQLILLDSVQITVILLWDHWVLEHGSAGLDRFGCQTLYGWLFGCCVFNFALIEVRVENFDRRNKLDSIFQFVGS